MTNLIQSQEVLEVLVQNSPNVVSSQTVIEALVQNNPNVVASQIVIEVLIPVSNTLNNTLTIAGNSACDMRDGSGFFKTQSIDGFASTGTPLPGWGYFATESIGGICNVNLITAYGILGSLSINGISAITIDVSYGLFMTAAAIADIALVGVRNAYTTLTVAAIGDLSSPGGVVYFNNSAIEGISNVSQLPGWSYSNSVSIDGISDFTELDEYLKNFTLSIDGISASDASSQYGVLAIVSFAGVSACAVDSNWDSQTLAAMSSISFISVENIYDILYDTNAYCSITVVGEPFKNNDEAAASQGSFSADCTGVFNRGLTDGLLIEQFVTYKKPTAFAFQTLTLTQTVGLSKIHNATVTQTLTLTQDAEGARGIIHTLSISQMVSVTKVKNLFVTQTLALTQSGDRNIVVSCNVSQTLVFNVPVFTTTPIIGSQGGGNQTQFQYQQPLVNVVLKPSNCLVILGTPTQSVILPCPIFGDSQSYSGSLNLKKTMTGDTFTYIKKTDTEKLKYTFQIGTYKALELRAFLLNHSHELITLHNWKGETWYVFLMNNPFEFSHMARWQPKGERVDITLEFEGIRA